MQQGVLSWLLLSVSLAVWPLTAQSIEMAPETKNKLLQDIRLQNKVAELMQYIVQGEGDSLQFALQHLALPQQEVVRYLLLQKLEQQKVILTPPMIAFVESQQSVKPLYQTVQKGDGYEFTVPAFDYPSIANRLMQKWKQDQKVLDFVLQAEHGELDLKKWLSGHEQQVRRREALLMREVASLSPQAIQTLTKQLTDAPVTGWLPSTQVMVRLVQVSGDPSLYKLLWLMRSDYNIESELHRLTGLKDSFSISQVMAAAANPRLKEPALKALVRLNPMPENVKEFLVSKLALNDDASFVAKELAEQGHRHWLEAIVQSDRKVNS